MIAPTDGWLLPSPSLFYYFFFFPFYFFSLSYEVVIPSARKGKGKTHTASWTEIATSMSSVMLQGLQRQQQLAHMRAPAALALRKRVLDIIPHIDESNFLAKVSFIMFDICFFWCLYVCHWLSIVKKNILLLFPCVFFFFIFAGVGMSEAVRY